MFIPRKIKIRNEFLKIVKRNFTNTVIKQKLTNELSQFNLQHGNNRDINILRDYNAINEDSIENLRESINRFTEVLNIHNFSEPYIDLNSFVIISGELIIGRPMDEQNICNTIQQSENQVLENQLLI